MKRLENISIPNSRPITMIFVKGGEFPMGSREEDKDAFESEKPQHPVRLPDYYIGQYPVTQELWRAVANAAPEFKLEEDPSDFKGDSRPVENVSWNDITKSFLPALHKITGRAFRLPTEAEWEYAARGGMYHQEENYTYSGSDRLKDVGWYDENSNGETKPVGKKHYNPLGIYDMSGNVWEWCADVFDKNFYRQCLEQGVVENPCNLEQGVRRVLRGGSCFYHAQACRVACRLDAHPVDRNDHIGCRLVLQFSGKGVGN